LAAFYFVLATMDQSPFWENFFATVRFAIVVGSGLPASARKALQRIAFALEAKMRALPLERILVP
jgi:hypothetical protein